MTPIKPILGAAFAAALSITAAQAQTVKDTDATVLIVEGEAQVEHAPDWATLALTLRGEGTTQADAVAAMSALRVRLEGDLARLPGAPVVGLDASALDVSIVRGKDCGNPDDAPMPDRAVLSQGACAPIGAVAKLDLELKISPATALSEVAAHAVADGADRPHDDGSGVTDLDALKRDAMRQALANAQARAETMAAASGRQLGPILRIDDGSARSYDEELGRLHTFHDKAVSVRLEKLPPPPPLSLTAPPVRADASVSVIYQLQ